eukprot:1134194-Rhodomonas_salina.1
MPCPHGRQRSTCKDCGGVGVCEHGRRRTRCKDCGGGSICNHRHVRSACKECSGSQICEHNRERSKCKECKGGSICEHQRVRSQCKECSGSQICGHNKMRHSCRLCNSNHAYYGIHCHHGRGSDFEDLMIKKLHSVLPASAKMTEQYPVPNLIAGRNPFRLDLVVTINDAFEFVVEIDGPNHYPDGCRRTLGDPVTQMKRDRFVENWALQNKKSIFRVPYTCRTQKRSAAAINYICNAAVQDHLEKKAHVHYLDYENTYIRIDELAFNTEDVEFIISAASSLCHTVYIRSK